MPGIDLDTSRKAVELAERFPQLFAAVGIHPNTPDARIEETLQEIKSLARHPKVAAIGEIGLDDHWHDTDPAYQRRILMEQLDIAAQIQKPVVLHSRDSIETLLPMIQAWSAKLAGTNSPLENRAGVLHAFEGSLEQATQAAQAGFFIGLGGAITFQNARDKHQIANELPLVNIVIETDAPYLTPHPHRGKRNEPANVVLVARKLAELKRMELDQIAEATTRNANHLFLWSH